MAEFPPELCPISDEVLYKIGFLLHPSNIELSLCKQRVSTNALQHFPTDHQSCGNDG
jgi:hypothetical protein